MFAISIMNGLVMGVIYALAALGVSLVVGIMNVVNFAHGEFLMLGAYLSYLLFAFRGVDPLLSLGLAFLAAFLVGALPYHGLIRPVLKAPELNQMLLTFGLSGFLQNLAQDSSVFGKILVLALIVLFLQWRPAGLFVTRSRSLD